MRSESPKVSFNSDVHVKRISSRGSSDSAMRGGVARRISSSPNGHHHHQHYPQSHQSHQVHHHHHTVAATLTSGVTDHDAPSKTRRKHHMVSRGVGTSDSRSTTPVISTGSQTSIRKKSSGSGSQSRDKFSTLPARGSSKHREAKEERFGSLERQKTSKATSAAKDTRRALDKKQLSPIIEQDSPWTQEEEKADKKSMANGSAKKDEDVPIKADKKNGKKQKEPKKKKESLGQRMRQLFARKKKDKKDENKKKKDSEKEDGAGAGAEAASDRDPVKTRYTEYKATDVTDNETDQYAVVVPSGKRPQRQSTPPGQLLDSRRSSSDHSKASWYGHHEGRHMSKSIEEKVYQFEKKTSSPSADLRFTGGGHQTEEEEQEDVHHVDDRQDGGGHVRHKMATTEDEDEPHSEPGLGGHRQQLLRPGGDSSGAESTTEDLSVHSHKSVVYLHSAAVVDIPGSSRGSPSPSPPYRKTVTRSLSVMGPWTPRGFQPTREVDYSATTLGRPPRPPQKKLVFTGPSFDPERFRQPTAPRQRTANGKTRK